MSCALRWVSLCCLLVVSKNVSLWGQCGSVVFLGDSNTSLFYLQPFVANQVPSLSESMRFSELVQQQTLEPVYNEGRGGHKTYDFFPIAKKWQKGAGIYIVNFGLNDARDIKEKFNNDLVLALKDFNKNTWKLIELIKQVEGKVVLMTNSPVDYPQHFSYNQNPRTDVYDGIYRRIASIDPSIKLLDVNALLKDEIKKGNWDIHIRNSSLVEGKWVLDDRYDSLFPDSTLWFTNIHYNIKGSKLVAQYVVDYLRRSTSCRIIP